MKKEKFTPCIISSREGLEATVADVILLKIQYAGLTAAMEEEIAKVQKRHQDGMLEVARRIETQEAGIYTYCQQHRKELFPEKKSIDMLLAEIGFRDEPHSVEKASKKDTWGAIAKRLLSLAWGKQYLTDPDPEIDKRALLADRKKITAEQLAAAGIKFEADEIFYIKPKSEVAEKSVQEAA